MISKNQRTIYVIVIIIAIGLLSVLTWKTIKNNTTVQKNAEELSENKELQQKQEELQMMVTDEPGNELLNLLIKENFDFEANLVDVSGGDATGTAMAKYRAETKYQLLAEFEDLPELEEGYFYEGWLVRPEPFEFISTGKVELVEGDWYDVFESDTDYTEYSKYVLTLEPDDGDPAPADHVVEGSFEEVVGVK